MARRRTTAAPTGTMGAPEDVFASVPAWKLRADARAAKRAGTSTSTTTSTTSTAAKTGTPDNTYPFGVLEKSDVEAYRTSMNTVLGAIANAPTTIGQPIEPLPSKITDQYEATLGQLGDVTSDLLAGKIPKSVQDQIKQLSLEKGTQYGLGGSPAGRNLVARDLGLQSLAIQQSGIQAAQAYSQAIGAEEEFRAKNALAINAAAQDYGKIALERRRLDLTGMELFSDVVNKYHTIGLQYSQTKGLPKDVQSALRSDFGKLIQTLRSLI